MAEGAVVHVHNPFPEHSPWVNAQIALFALDVVVNEGGQQVVGLLNSAKVTCKVEVDVLHGQYLRLPAAGSTPFDAENRAQGGLPKHHHCFLPDLLQPLAQPDRYSGFALSSGRWGNGRYQDKVALPGFFCINQGEGEFGFVVAVAFQAAFRHAQFGGNRSNILKRCLLSNFNVSIHVWFYLVWYWLGHTCLRAGIIHFSFGCFNDIYQQKSEKTGKWLTICKPFAN